MKKVYNLLAIATLMFASATNAVARYWAYDSTAPVAATDVQAGVSYAFQSGFGAAEGQPWFLAGDRFVNSANLTPDQIYQFVAVEGEKDAEDRQVFYLKRQNGSNEYVAEPGNPQFYTTAVDRAWKVVVKDPVYVNLGELSYEHPYKDEETGEDKTKTLKGLEAHIQMAKDNQDAASATLSQLTTNVYGQNGGVVIVSYQSNNTADEFAEYKFFTTHNKAYPGGSYPAKVTNYDLNLWVIYPAYQQNARDAFNAVVEEVMGANSDLEKLLENYKLGTEPGQYSKDKFDALIAVWKRVQAAQNNNDASEAELDALAEEFPKAYDAFITSGVGLRPGFYIMTNWRSEAENNADNTKYDSGALYDVSSVNPNVMGVSWTFDGKKNNNVTYKSTDELTYKSLKFIWQVTEDSKNPGLFFFQNVDTKNYIGVVKKGNTKIPVTKTPEASYTIVANPSQPGFFSFYSPELFKNAGAEYGGIHAAGDYENVVAWDWRSGGSSWSVRSITQAEIDALYEAAKQPIRNEKMAKLVNKAQTAIANGHNYMGVGADGQKIAHSQTGEFGDPDGLITKAEQLSCPMNESNENEGNKNVQVEVLLDKDFTTYMHSAWSSGDRKWLGGHFLQMKFDNAEDKLFVKWAKRLNGTNVNNSGAPSKVVFWGTNDESKLEITKTETTNEANETVVNYDGWKKQGWDSLGVSFFKYEKEVLNGETKIANAAGATYAEFKTPYKYVRMEVVERVANGDVPAGNKYFHGSELRVYKGAYDPTTSLIEVVAKETVNALKVQIAKAEEEVKAEKATEETLAALQKAYDDFMNSYPDPNRVRTAIAAAKALEAAAQEDAKLGYYAAGSKAEFKAVIDKVETEFNAVLATRPPTVEQVNDFIARLDAATAVFNGKLQFPTDGYYTIMSVSVASKEVNYGRKLYAASSSRENAVKMGGRMQKDGAWTDDPLFQNSLAQYWQVTKQDTGYVMKNLFTGLYLAPVKGESKVSQSVTPYVVPLQFAKFAGAFNLVIGKQYAAGNNIYMNAQPNTWNLVTWSEAVANDNSAFAFQKVEEADLAELLETGISYELQSKDKPQIITFPIDVLAEGGFYTVLGQKQDDFSIQLQKVEGKLTAGQAYVYIPEEGATDTHINLGVETKLADLKPIHEPLAPVNGLVGVFENAETPVAAGVFNADRSKVLRSEKDKVAPNTGYFGKLPATTATGDKQLEANGLITSIGFVQLDAQQKSKGIYNLQGVRFSSVKQLPAGVYVVNGKKVVVK